MKNEIKQRSETKWIAGVIGCVALGATLLSPSSALASAPWTNYFEGFETGVGIWGGTTVQKASGTYGITAASGSYYGLVTPTGSSYPGYVNANEHPQYTYTSDIQFPGRLDAAVDLYLDMNSGTTGQQWLWYFTDFYGNGANNSPVNLVATKTATGWDMLLGDWYGSSSSVNVTDTGWYRMQTRFYDNGNGYLAEQSQFVRRSDGSTVVSLASDYNLYAPAAINNFSGWVQAGFSLMGAITNTVAGYEGVAFDNVNIVPEPTAAALFAVGGLLLLRRKR